MLSERVRHLMLVADVAPDPFDCRTPARSVTVLDLRHPELAPVLRRAMSAVIHGLELDDQTPADLINELTNAAASAMTEAYQPFAEAQSRLARFTEASRDAEATSVRKRAREAAALVSETASALRHRHDLLAERLAEDTAGAARAAAGSSVPGYKSDARKQARRVADAARNAATARADRRAAAAALTAAAARQAEVELASEADRAARVVQHDALQAAATSQATAMSIMYEVAINAACRRFVIASRDPRDDPR